MDRALLPASIVLLAVAIAWRGHAPAYAAPPSEALCEKFAISATGKLPLASIQSSIDSHMASGRTHVQVVSAGTVPRFMVCAW